MLSWPFSKKNTALCLPGIQRLYIQHRLMRRLPDIAGSQNKDYITFFYFFGEVSGYFALFKKSDRDRIFFRHDLIYIFGARAFYPLLTGGINLRQYDLVGTGQ